MKFLPAQQDTPRVNLTPLIDVVFLLLIFLMVSTSFVDSSSLNIQLPQASQQPTPQELQLELGVSRSGEYMLEGQVVEAASLYPKLESLALQRLSEGQAPESISVRLSADGEAPHAAVVKAMDSLSRAGFGSVSIATLYNGRTP